MKPTRTINRIHFTDLDASRFEDLCLAILYRLNATKWISINHFGRSGRDRGVDISAVEELENESRRKWFIQCKRHKSISKTELESVIEKALKRIKAPPDIILLMTACDVSREKLEYFQGVAHKKGINRAEIWTSSIIEAKLYSEYHDLLFAYFGISLSQEKRNRIATIRRNIKLKQRMTRDFYKKSIDREEARRSPFSKFVSSEIIIHSVDDNLYPDFDRNPITISPWFKVELFNFYHNGIEVCASAIGAKAKLYNDGRWELVPYDKLKESQEGELTSLLPVHRIPYENIVEYDIDGDEYFGGPHIYCLFNNNGSPYEEIVYYVKLYPDDPKLSYYHKLDNKDRITAKSSEPSKSN